ncbi:hypothetical protein [Kribbella swartbergensis]
MADTDDEQTVALEPDQREQGDDDSPEALSERRGAGKWVRDGEHPAGVLTPEEEAALRDEEELEELHEEEIELDAQEERELQEVRHRREVLDATAETTEAMRLADVAESRANRLRSDAAAERRQGRSDRAHGHHLLDEAAARPDEPGADATAAAGRRYQRAAEREDRAARYDEGAADRYDAEARDRRSEAAHQPGQPPAAEAVRNPPAETPTARKYVKRRKQLKKQRTRNPGELRDIGLGD